MPFYLFQGRYTSDAIKAMITKPQDREVAARSMIEAMGGKLHHMFFCFGHDDVVALIEAPDDETAAGCTMIVGASGAMSGGATTKLLTSAQAQAAMKKAGAGVAKYTPATG
ncbi:GYD domain-containing protein [Thalassococcus sp. CAU 1522]|uniref:GYD domain-containing protein n=1 Tax=Thalassococcus arenae TaxID=2851652 RepID=A0ABS6NB04_9RHOB|nr:GYD domain-containing protein [Thalassococcus arenae]MBV2360857.1 GYD domain-containing protein [Thalassococcus arenae]